MALTPEYFHAIIYHNFRRGLPGQENIDELKFLYGDEAPPLETGLMNSIEADRLSKTNSAKVVQKRPISKEH